MDFTRFKAILWDMDGTIIDTGPLHFQTWQLAFDEAGIPFTYEKFLAAFGQNNRVTVLFNDPTADDARVKAIIDRKENLFRERLAGSVILFEDAIALLEGFASRGVKQALATSSPIENIETVFASVDLERYFDAVISGDSLPPKPDPTIFLKAAEVLGVDPADCLVIEDSIMGVRAGKSAGMTVAAFTHSFSAEKLHEADYFLMEA